MGNISNYAAQMGAGLEYFHLGLFIDLLDIILTDTEKGK